VTKQIAIVGGGIAGLYTAWRLLQQNKLKQGQGDLPFRIHLYEKEGLGGRIRSQNIPCIPFKPELGAMRFRRSHMLLNALLKELEIPTRDFNLPSPVFYIRGRRLTSSEIAGGRCGSCHAESPFHLRPGEFGKSAAELVMFAIRGILKALNFPNLHQSKARQVKRKIREEDFDDETWYRIKEEGVYQGLRLYNIGFWNLLVHFLSNEAYVMVHEVLSLESILGNWNAAEAIPWFIAEFASDQFDMVPGGLSLVATRLYDKICEMQGQAEDLKDSIDIKVGYDVSSVDASQESWTVRYKYGENEGTVEQTGESKYDKVILALPKRALLKLKVNENADPHKKQIKQQPNETWPPKWARWVSGHRMIKIFLLYAEPWWMGDNFPGYDTGRIFTDLPLRQIYHFSPTWMKDHGVVKPEETKKTDKGGLALVMASYSDEHYVSFWEPMLKPNPNLCLAVEPDQPYLQRSTKIGDSIWKEILSEHSELLASRRMVEKVHLLMQEIHGREIPHPILGIARDWDAGWHTWIVGAKPWEKTIRKERVQPLDGLYLCGEAYSPEQGWIEGALKSSEQVLQEFKLEKPDWLESLHVNLSGYIDPYRWLDEQKGDSD
jgi:monoamine oxidase